MSDTLTIVDADTGEPVAAKAPGARVLVRLDDRAEWYGDPALGIAMHGRSYRQPITGTVLSVGPRAALGLAVGDRVVFGKYNGVRLPRLKTADGGEVWSMDADYVTRKRADGHPHIADVYGGLEV